MEGGEAVVGFEADVAFGHGESVLDKIDMILCAGPVKGGPALVVLGANVGVVEFGQSLGVQEVTGDHCSEELGSAKLIDCAGVRSSPKRSEDGFLGDAADVLVEVLEPCWSVTKLYNCDTELVVKSGIGNNTTGKHLAMGHRRMIWVEDWRRLISCARVNVVHEIFRKNGASSHRPD